MSLEQIEVKSCYSLCYSRLPSCLGFGEYWGICDDLGKMILRLTQISNMSKLTTGTVTNMKAFCEQVGINEHVG